MGGMQTPPQLTDRSALMAHRARAQDAGDFLRQACADEVQERLTEVNRTFTSPAIVTGHPAIWVDRLPNATVVADVDTLDLQQGAHDLVIHDLSLHWAGDPVGQLVQCRRALAPDGLLIATLFGGQTLHELRAALAEAEALVAGGLSPRIAPMAEIRDVGALLQRAGFALPVADSTTYPVSYANAFHLMHDLRTMGETNALSGRIKHFTRRNVMTEAASIYATHFGAADRIPATFEIITLTGWAPSKDQPKPLRPGSAKTRLADALGTEETNLKRSND